MSMAAVVAMTTPCSTSSAAFLVCSAGGDCAGRGERGEESARARERESERERERERARERESARARVRDRERGGGGE